MKKDYWLNLKGKVIHDRDCGEQCNRDDTDELEEVPFRRAAEELCFSGFTICRRMEEEGEEAHVV